MKMLSSLARENASITDLSNMLEDFKNQPFVDSVHYTPEVSEMVSDKMFRKISATLASIY